MSDLTQAKKLIKECHETHNPHLDLGKCGITDLNKLPELFECTHLETLILSNSWIENNMHKFSCNKGKDNLLSSIPKKISNLKKLTQLFIGDNWESGMRISDISFLSDMTQLQSLDLCKNKISDISFLSDMTQLQSLNLSFNEISDYHFLSGMTQLQSLHLRSIEISDYSFLSGLSQIQSLDLGFNEISDISFLSGLTQLQSLDLGDNKISDISFLLGLTQLQSLNLSFNKISDISFLSGLTQLQSLNLSFNEISDYYFLSGLTQLQSLDLRNNQIKEIPEFIFRINMEINLDQLVVRGLCLYDNPIESPPMEILKQGRESILNWFKAKKKSLNEIKIILIGEPKAGKTSLLKRLKENDFNENEVQTDGINIEDIEFGKCDTFKKQKSLHNITGHFWDFGGQEIMNSTHQLFLTKRSVYVLVLEARKDLENASKIRDWLRRVQATGGNSPIIVVANQIDIHRSFGFVNERELRDEFPQIKCFLKISCKKNTGISKLKDELAKLIPTVEFFNSEIDEKWINVKNKIQKETKDDYFLSESRFQEICNEFDLTEETEQDNAIKFLHDLGLVLHFEDINLADYYVLNPYWITYGVYQIVTSAYAGKVDGIVSMNKLDFIVNKEKEKKDKYNPPNFRKIIYNLSERRFLIYILNYFKLCFYISERNEFIIPDLLDTKEPYNVTEPILLSKDKIQFVYRYNYLQNFIIHSIMVGNHNDAKEMWRTGCIIENNTNCKALITSYENKITITVTGEYKMKREFMSVIRHTLDSINSKLPVNNKPVCLIPLPEIKDGFVEYETLLAREKKGKPNYYFDEDKPTEKVFLISELLDGIQTEDELKKILQEKIDSDEKFQNETIKILLGIESGNNEIKSMLASYYEYFKAYLPNYSEIKDSIEDSIRKLNDQQTNEIVNEVMTYITTAFGMFDDETNEKLKELKEKFNNINETPNVQTKLMMYIPLASLLATLFPESPEFIALISSLDFKLQTTFNFKKWWQDIYKKLHG